MVAKIDLNLSFILSLSYLPLINVKDSNITIAVTKINIVVK